MDRGVHRRFVGQQIDRGKGLPAPTGEGLGAAAAGGAVENQLAPIPTDAGGEGLRAGIVGPAQFTHGGLGQVGGLGRVGPVRLLQAGIAPVMLLIVRLVAGAAAVRIGVGVFARPARAGVVPVRPGRLPGQHVVDLFLPERGPGIAAGPVGGVIIGNHAALRGIERDPGRRIKKRLELVLQLAAAVTVVVPVVVILVRSPIARWRGHRLHLAKIAGGGAVRVVIIRRRERGAVGIGRHLHELLTAPPQGGVAEYCFRDDRAGSAAGADRDDIVAGTIAIVGADVRGGAQPRAAVALLQLPGVIARGAIVHVADDHDARATVAAEGIHVAPATAARTRVGGGIGPVA